MHVLELRVSISWYDCLLLEVDFTYYTYLSTLSNHLLILHAVALSISLCYLQCSILIENYCIMVVAAIRMRTDKVSLITRRCWNDATLS